MAIFNGRERKSMFTDLKGAKDQIAQEYLRLVIAICQAIITKINEHISNHALNKNQ